MENLSEVLTNFRIESGKNQREFAELIGVPQTTWSGYEKGKTKPPMQVLFALAENGYKIKGLTTNPIDDLAEEGKIDKEEFRKRLEIAKSFPPDMSIDDFAKALRAIQEIEKQSGLIAELEKIIRKTIESSKTVLEHESRLAALEERLSTPKPEAEYPPETGEGDGYTADAEPEYGEPAGAVAYREDIAAGPPIEQSEDESLVVDVPLRFIRTRPEDYYVLRIRGNSMIDALIPDGSMALIRKSEAPLDGKIQVVRVDGRATLKRMREGEAHGWTLCYEDGTGRTIPLGAENLVQGDFVAVLPPSTRPRMRGEQ